MAYEHSRDRAYTNSFSESSEEESRKFSAFPAENPFPYLDLDLTEMWNAGKEAASQAIKARYMELVRKFLLLCIQFQLTIACHCI